MNLFGVGILLCMCLVVVNPEEDYELMEGSRKGKQKRHSKGPAKKRGKTSSIGKTSYLKSYSVSTSVKGMTCKNGKCHQYGSTNSLPGSFYRNPKWVMKIKDVQYFCYNENVHSCPQFEGGTYNDYAGSEQPDTEKMKQFQKIVCGRIYLCYAPNKKLCPDVQIPDSDWKVVTLEKIYILRKGPMIIVCVASDIENCYEKHGHDGWSEEEDVPRFKDVVWYIVMDGVKYYCTKKKMKDCPKVGGSHQRDWKRYCDKDDIEDCTDTRRQWELAVDGAVIICLADDIEDCKKQHKGHWKRSDRDRNDKGKPKDISWFIDGGSVTIYCDAKKASSCPKLIKGGRQWKEVQEEEPDYPETSGGEWKQQIKGVTVICVADDIKDCKKVHTGHWTPATRDRDENGVPEDVRWVIVINDVKVYCGAKEKKSCPKLKKGGNKWDKVTPGKPDKPDETEEEGVIWEQEVKGVTIICVADDIKDCKKVHKGNWSPSDRKKDKHGVPKGVIWVIVTNNVNVYCEETESDSCPKLQKGGNKWKKVSQGDKDRSDETEEDGVIWEQEVKGVTIICVADDIKDCKKVHKGNWSPSDRKKDKHGVPKGFIWVIVTNNVKVYCEATESDSCPKLQKGGNKWKKVSQGDKDRSDETEEEGVIWEQEVKGVTIICVADDIKDCKKVHKGNWSPSDRKKDKHGVPKGVLWVIVTNNVNIYCEATESDSCPKLQKGGNKWKKVSQGDKDRSDETEEDGVIWEQEVKGVTIICVADDIKDCKKVHKGNWSPSDRKKDKNGLPKGVGWIIIIGDVKAYCDAEDVKSCPSVKGKKWDSINGKGSKHRVPGENSDFDADRIVPELTGGGRFHQPQGDDTVLLCYSKDADSCPNGGKWIQTKKDSVGEKVTKVITGICVWVKQIGDQHVVCVADDIKSCKPAGNGWVIITGMEAGLWQTTKNDVPIYCDAADESNCPDEVGGWELITKGDQMKQTTLELKKKLEMWRLVTFKYTIYCDAKYKGKCPKIVKYAWHKISGNEVDFESYGKEIVFESKVGKSWYGCTAKKKVACPELPNDESWTQIEKNVGLEQTLIFFEDIEGFEGACRAGICSNLKKGDDVFDQGDFDRRRKSAKKKRGKQ